MIVGPGNAYVAEAKRQLYGKVGQLGWLASPVAGIAKHVANSIHPRVTMRNARNRVRSRWAVVRSGRARVPDVGLCGRVSQWRRINVVRTRPLTAEMPDR